MKKKQISGFSGKLNPAGKLEHMAAPDLFEAENITQVFSAKTGNWIGTIRNGTTDINEDQEPQEDQPEPDDPNQLSLF